MSATAEAWLTIPDRAALLLGGVRWSHGCDALEDASGQTIALAVQLEQVFDGLFVEGPVPHFAYVIGLLRAMKFGSTDSQFARLHRAYVAAGGATALARNAGVLIGYLCRDLPWKHRPALDAVRQVLQSMQRNGERRRPAIAEEPPLPVAEMLARIATQLESCSEASLSHWLRFGRGGLPESTAPVEAIDSLPARVLKLLTAARTNPRLAGAASLVPVLDAALALPPRKQSPQALPQGGYADVTTRGDPERLLPSQFALDPDDFIRRFAEKELLYFKREEPHQSRKPERVIVLDQGVRTWGRVRLALAGAALSLLKAEARRGGDVQLWFTATVGAVDLRRHDFDGLVELLSASDLTPDPSDAFTRALSEPCDPAVPRDVILLTHPSNLHVPFVEAKRLQRPGDRVFALAVTEDGTARLDEILDGGFRTVRSFKLDLAAAEALRIERPARPVNFGPWTGDVEPIGFPFRPGLIGDPQAFAFSADGEWLAILSRDGLVHGLALDGSPPEILPRAFSDGVVLKTVDAMLSVTDGVVLCGRMKKSITPGLTVTINSPIAPVMTTSAIYDVPAPESDEDYVVAHYDYARRHLRLYKLRSTIGGARWAAFPVWQCVVLLPDNDEPYHVGIVLDLSPGEVAESTRAKPLGFGRPNEALVRARTESSPPYGLPMVVGRVYREPRVGWPYLHLIENKLQVEQASLKWRLFEPLQDGKPLLAGKTIHSARLADPVLAMLFGNASGPRQDTLMLFRGPDGAILGECQDVARSAPFNLSPDGSRLARCFGKRSVGVHPTSDLGRRLAATPPARLHNAIDIRILTRPFQLILRIGQHHHRFQVTDTALAHEVTPLVTYLLHSKPVAMPMLEYDATRFPPNAGDHGEFFRASLDRWGAVHLSTDYRGLVASFLIRRDKAAAWIPDGTFWGDASLIGGAAHPDAAARIGKAIHDARQGIA